ncbi:MAG: DUF721 domain-containing protein [Gammaproteobacteria bacterium]
MANVSPKSLANLLQQRSDHLSMLLSQVRLLRRITAVIRHFLPEPLSLHCHAANIDGGTLVIGCDSSTWAAKLRYQSPHILKRLGERRDLPAFRHIRVRVQPHDRGEPHSSNRPLAMSDHTAALIASVADDTADPQLKAALLRLSKRAKPVKNR